MQWWNSFVEWASSDAGWRIVSGAVVPFVAIVLAGVVAALIGRAAMRRVVAMHDDEAKAAAVAGIVSAARKAAIGPRVIPPTRINLSKMGKTDGRLVFVAHRLLSSGGTVFKSLSGSLTLDHRVITVRNVV